MKNKRKKIFATIVLAAAFIINLPAFAMDKVPGGWIKAGSEPENYEVGIERYKTGKNKNSAYLLSLNPEKIGEKSFGTLMQYFPAKKYLGKRIKLSGFVKTEKVNGWTGLWMRVDGNKKILAFDNMQNRAIKGTTDWKKYDIILDVPKDSTGISFGVLLGGQGKVWIDDFSFETVNQSIKTTNINDKGEK